jgi:5-hydroxyisourate hydrolase-like protein (transthyretin family)
VTSATNVGVAGSMVYATTQAGAEYWTTTDAFGNYTLGNVPAGTYTVYFDATVKQTVKNLLVGQSRQRVDARVALKAQIKGRVTATDGQGAAIPDVAVRVFSATNDSVPLAWAFTDSDGNYFVHGLPAGNVKVHFELDYVTAGSYLPSWNSGQASFFTADSLSLTATQLRTGVNAGLTRAGQITGQVHMEPAPPRYSGIWISLSDLASEWNTVAWASTDDEGRYVLRHVPTGRYRIKFQLSESNLDNFVPRWFSPMGTGESFALGGVISVTGDQIVTGIDQDLQAGGHIQGVVTNAAGAGIAGVRVIAYADFDNFNFTSSATTDATGGYTIRGLPQGGYKLQFAAELVTTASYRSQWWIDQPTMESSSLISLLPGENASGFNVALTKSAQISGTVTNSAKKGVAGVSVYLIGPKGEWDFITSVETGPSGAYTLRGVAAGTYKLRFDASYAATGSYVSTWSGSKATYAAATGVTVSATQVKSGVNATLTTAAQISGTVTTGAGVGVPGVMVSLVDPVSGEATNMTTATDSAGKYTLRGVDAGSYKVSFNAEWVTVGSFLSNWNSGAENLAGAPTISVAKGATKTGVNSVLSGAGYISSVVITGDAPVAGAVFEAYLASGDGSTPVARATTDSNGRLTIRGLKDGNYKLHMDTSGVTEGSVASGWMWGTTFADAGIVEVRESRETFRAITPETAGNMYGQITFDGQGIRGVRVEAYLPSDTNTPVASGLTDSSGNYLVRGIPQGTFKVRLSTEQVANGNYMSQWYGNTVGNVIGGDAANAVEMGMPHAVSINFNQTLTAAAALSGYLTTVTGDVLAGVQVTLIDAADESMEVATTQTNVVGSYSFRGVAQGAYKLRFDPSNYVGANLRVTWLNEKSSFSAAENINVTWGQSFAFGTSEVLAGAQALGKVTAKAGGKGIAGVTVVLCPIAIPSTCYVSTTDAAGNYAISGIAAGSYRVNFDSATAAASYLPNFWTNVTTWDDATFVYFASRQVRTMNAQLVAAATVSGRVTNGAGEGIQDVQVMTYSTATERWLGAYAFTDAQGYYTLKGVQAGGVKLKFAADHARGAYVSEWSNDKATFSLADTITLAAGKNRSSVNAVLAPSTWTSLQGNLPTGGAGATVEVFDSSQQLVKTATADQTGHYEVTDLPQGTFRVKFTPVETQCYDPNWYVTGNVGATSFGQASDIVITDRSVRTLDNTTFTYLACA